MYSRFNFRGSADACSHLALSHTCFFTNHFQTHFSSFTHNNTYMLCHGPAFLSRKAWRGYWLSLHPSRRHSWYLLFIQFIFKQLWSVSLWCNESLQSHQPFADKTEDAALHITTTCLYLMPWSIWGLGSLLLCVIVVIYDSMCCQEWKTCSISVDSGYMGSLVCVCYSSVCLSIIYSSRG